MKRTSARNLWGALVVAAVSLFGGVQARAQTPGYITGVYGIEAFSVASGAIVNSFYPTGFSGAVAVSADGTTIYSAGITGGTLNVLSVLSSATGETLFQVPGLYGTPKKAILDVTGAYAFVLCNSLGGGNSVTIVNLVKKAVVGYVHVAGGTPYDIAISPNGSKLFVSMQPTPGVDSKEATPPASDPPQGPIYSCKAVDNSPTLCIFNTQPFGLASSVEGVSGDLALSQGGTWLYSWSPGAHTYLTVLDTGTLAVSRVTMPKGDYVLGFATAPAGNQAVILVESGDSSVFLVLDTKTNAITETFPGLPSQLPSEGSNVLAFSSDGTSLWSIGGCIEEYSCLLVEGQTFPAGKLISQTSVTPYDSDAQAITF